MIQHHDIKIEENIYNDEIGSINGIIRLHCVYKIIQGVTLLIVDTLGCDYKAKIRRKSRVTKLR